MYNTQQAQTNFLQKQDDLQEEQPAQAQQQEPAPQQTRRRSAAEYVLRYLTLVVGLLIMSAGVVLSIKAELGTSPISGNPYVLNLITGLTVGTTTIIVNTIIVLLQIVLLRKRFEWINLLQIPVCVVFGLLTDLMMVFFEGLVLTAYWQQWLVCIAGILLVAVGVSFEVTAGVVTLPGEGLALALCKLIPVKFGYVKVMVDVSLVVIAVILSFAFLHELQGVREGTVAAAVFVGLIARGINRFLVPAGNKLYATCQK